LHFFALHLTTGLKIPGGPRIGYYFGLAQKFGPGASIKKKSRVGRVSAGAKNPDHPGTFHGLMTHS
jgi:hypothetical protein